MYLRKLFPFILLAFSIQITAQEPSKIKMYGFVRSDFFYNSRQNVEVIDGLFHIFPKPIELNAGVDKNAVPQAEMLSVATRFGFDITGADVLGAKSSAKIETDFAGFGSNFYILRIRHAYAKLNWAKSELLVGQTWHPLFGSIMPVSLSLNAGAPFQPFNRSPQVRYKYSVSASASFMAAASYQMQYVSQGPLGSTAVYQKNTLLPDFFIGAESKTGKWTSGVGVDLKTIKPAAVQLVSASAVAYTQFAGTKFQFRAKSILGENLSDYLMPCGYGVKDTTSTGSPLSFTNLRVSSTWVNLVYGSKIQAGVFIGYSQNLGANQNLISKNGNFTAYGYGIYNQIMLDRLYRIAPHVSYNLPNLKFGFEYDFTAAKYGKLKSNGLVSDSYTVSNNRIVASVSYLF